MAGAAILWVSVALGADAPLARLGVRSYTDLTNAISRLAKCIDPNETADPALELTGHLGMTNLAALDATRPWELALWHGGGDEPLLALKAPVKDVAQFKESLSPRACCGAKAAVGAS